MRAFKREALTISPHFAHKIQTTNVMNDESVDILESLSTGDSKPVPLDVIDKRFGTLDLLSSDELEKMIGIKEETGSDTTRLRKIQFNAYIKEKNLVKIDELAKTVILHIKVYSRLIDLIVEIGSVDQVLHYWKQVREAKPNFTLLRYQVARLGLSG